MKELKKKSKSKIFWIVMTAHVLIALAWIMQVYSLIDWENAFKMGLQVNSFLGDETEVALAGQEKGLAIADMILGIPLSIIAIIGLIRGKYSGYIASIMLFAICIYFPLFIAFQEWANNIETAIAAIVLWLVPSVIALIVLIKKRNYFIGLED